MFGKILKIILIIKLFKKFLDEEVFIILFPILDQNDFKVTL